MEEKIDIHQTERVFESEMNRLMKNENIINRNKELILKFVEDCRLGRTIKGRTKKKIGKRRILRYIFDLRMFSGWMGKPFDKVTQGEMEKIVFGIEDNNYKKKTGDNYSERTKHDFKKTLLKFYKWLNLSGLLDFMDMSYEAKEVPAITRQEVETLINSTPENETKAILMVLFDGGARIEELLNIRLEDVTKENYMNNECYWINIKFSKTFARRIPLPLSTPHLNKWLGEHPEKDNPESQLFPLTYPALSKRIKKLAKQALKKRLTPHMLRHSSATYWASKMNRQLLCTKYGWSYKSSMPDQYIKRKGIIFNEIAEKGDVDQTTKLQRENGQLREKMENIEHEYKKVRKALEFIMPVIMEKIDDNDFRKTILEKRKEQMLKGKPFLKEIQSEPESRLMC